MSDDRFAWITEPEVRLLEAARVVVARELSPAMVERLSTNARVLDVMTQRMALELVARVMREVLPPQVVTYRVQHEHHEAIGRPAHTTDFRWRSWWDMFCATYQQRWWGRALQLHRWKLRTVQVPVPYVNADSVTCDHTVVLRVRDAWMYPMPPAATGQGYAVLQHDAIEYEHHPTPGRSADPWA